MAGGPCAREMRQWAPAGPRRLRRESGAQLPWRRRGEEGGVGGQDQQEEEKDEDAGGMNGNWGVGEQVSRRRMRRSNSSTMGRITIRRRTWIRRKGDR
eukprot:5250546-Pyramimonas_sp.AAC.1